MIGKFAICSEISFLTLEKHFTGFPNWYTILQVFATKNPAFLFYQMTFLHQGTTLVSDLLSKIGYIYF